MKSVLILFAFTQVLGKIELDVSNLLDLEIKFHQIVYDANTEEWIGDLSKDDLNATDVRLYGFGSVKREGPGKVVVDRGNYLMEFYASVPDLEIKIGKLISPVGEFDNISVKFEDNRLRKVLQFKLEKGKPCKAETGTEWIYFKGAKLTGHQSDEAFQQLFNGTFREALNTNVFRKVESIEHDTCKPLSTPFTALFV